MNISASSPLVSFSEAVTPLWVCPTQAILVVKLNIECSMRPECAKSLLNLDANSSLTHCLTVCGVLHTS